MDSVNQAHPDQPNPFSANQDHPGQQINNSNIRDLILLYLVETDGDLDLRKQLPDNMKSYKLPQNFKNITVWNTENVTDMSNLFNSNKYFKDYPNRSLSTPLDKEIREYNNKIDVDYF